MDQALSVVQQGLSPLPVDLLATNTLGVTNTLGGNPCSSLLTSTPFLPKGTKSKSAFGESFRFTVACLILRQLRYNRVGDVTGTGQYFSR